MLYIIDRYTLLIVRIVIYYYIIPFIGKTKFNNSSIAWGQVVT